jgi:hypothetical protein
MKNNETSDRDMLLSIYSDMFKDANGFRPRGRLFPSHLSTAELETALEGLQVSIHQQELAELEEEKIANDYISTFFEA